jgi:16S rRNA G527 N7-methylase RsmG
MTEIEPTPQEHVVFTEFEGNEGVLVDLNSKRYFMLNETATLIWRAVERRLPRAEIVRQMTETYDVTPERAAASLDKLLASMQAHRLLR